MVLVLGLASLLVGGTAGARQRISFMGGQVGGAYNFWTTLIAPVLSESLPDAEVSPEASTGSPENVRRVNAGEAELGLAFAVDLYNAWHGNAPFRGSLRSVRSLAYMFSNVAHIVVLADSDIARVEDLAGRRIAIGGPGSGSAVNGELFLRELGLWGRVRVVQLGGTSASQALKDRQVDAYNWHSNLGNATFQDTAATHDIRLLDLDRPARQVGFYEKYPYFFSTVIPAGIYRSVDVPTPTFATGSYWIANANVSPDLVYRMLSVVFSDRVIQRIKESIGIAAADFGPGSALNGIPIPLHPGAIRFWEERGFTIPAALRGAG